MDRLACSTGDDQRARRGTQLSWCDAGSGLSAEKCACALGDGDHCGVAELPLDGDGVEALPDRVESPDKPDPVLSAHLGLDGRRHREQPRTGLSERVEESAVLERTYHAGPDSLLLESLFQGET